MTTKNNEHLRSTRVDFIRHGEPEGGEVFRGRSDHALTERGRAQFRQRIERYQAQANWQRIISSPLQRCAFSATELAQRLNLPCVLDPQWAEIDYGDWENCSTSEIFRQHGDIANALWQDPLNFCAPNGESVGDFQQRLLKAWQQMLQQHKGERVLVCHGGVMRVLAQALLKLQPEGMAKLAIPFAGFMRINVSHSHNNQGGDQGLVQHWPQLISLDGEELCAD